LIRLPGWKAKPLYKRRSLVATLALLLSACGHVPTRQVIVLGIDGMDPAFVESHWAELPHLSKLRDRGAFSRLATTTPPQSPVAWSTFATGLDPADHQIFDFVHRDPVTLAPYLSTDRTEGPRFQIGIGPYDLPLSRSRVVALRKGKAFWETLSQQHINATVIRLPANYPPVAAGEALSGMGTPDLRGTQGTFSFFTDDPDGASRDVSGGLIRQVTVSSGHVDLRVEGPANPLRKDKAVTSALLAVDIDPIQPYARIRSGTSDAILRQGEWSDWVHLKLPLIRHLADLHGIARIYAKQLHPRFEMYVSALQTDPDSPELPISEPHNFAQTIAGETGPFYTLGIPEDTAAMRQGVFDLTEFLSQTRLVLADERRLFTHALNHYQDGLLFFYFSSVDQNSHMLWGKHDAELLKVYREIDQCVGQAAARFPNADLMVLSDHGFTTYDRTVHLNRWLTNHGFGGKAYAIGLNALYLKDRSVSAQLQSQLLAWQDDGKTVVETITPMRPSPVSPDFIMGYARGYRASWQTGLGESAATELEDNNDAWIADHCVNAADVPGVLFTSWNNGPRGESLKDLSATILGLFGAGHTGN
jgi:predicted AlkP superfamily phosphohydrolase/phosphomutase